MNERVVVIRPGQPQVGRKKLIRVAVSLDALGAWAVWRVRTSKEEVDGLAVMEEITGITNVVTGLDKGGDEYGYFEISLLPRRPGMLVIEVASGNEKFGNWRIEGTVTDPNGLANDRHVSTPAAQSAPALSTTTPEDRAREGFWRCLFRRGK